MKHVSNLAALALLCACGPAIADGTPDSLDQLAWLEGEWGTEGDGQWSEERWSDARGGMMIGTGRSGSGNALESFEFLRIVAEEGGKIAYMASPGGGGATRFGLTETSDNSAVFLNPDHDFPQRISYTRRGDTLAVEIAMADGSNAIGWELQLLE